MEQVQHYPRLVIHMSVRPESLQAQLAGERCIEHRQTALGQGCALEC